MPCCAHPASVFYSSLSSCGWCKDVWVRGLFSLRGILSSPEMREIVATMHDKGLRVRAEVREAEFEYSEASRQVAN